MSAERVRLSHLERLEAEAIDIMREVVAEAENPVMLYSIGKDSSVMLRLAEKAFWPAPPPFPFLHVDTTWKFQEMYAFRARMAEEHGLNLLVHVNEDGLARGINPFASGSQVHTDVMKTVRFRTLGCYPLTGAVESSASTLPEIIQEMLLARTSERQGRVIDHDASASMEKKKIEGYF